MSREVVMRLTPKPLGDAEHAEIVQELVRCKDCRWWEGSEDACAMYSTRLAAYQNHGTFRVNGFCWRGERREDE